MSLVGRSGRCKVRLATPGASRFHAALLRTPDGTWAVDLRSSDRLAVNGVRVDFARLAEGDELRLGELVARIGGLATPRPTALARRADAPADLRAVLEQVADLQHHSNGQFHELIAMVTPLFGSMHRDTMDLVREELEQIRGLAGELKALREESAARWGSSAGPTPGPPASPPVDGGDLAGPARPLDPGKIHLIVSERLAAFEGERRGRWERLSWFLSNAEP